MGALRNYGRGSSCPRTIWGKAACNEFGMRMDSFEIVQERFDWKGTATADSDVVQSGRPIFDDFFQHLWPYIGNNTANVVFQMIKRLWFIRIDQ
ncbi:hypothetical protein TNCV_947701 [Trichonephila clavipes]|nr:hypothetical protein TNCV_947701 [Trichonephila clavipes]